MAITSVRRSLDLSTDDTGAALSSLAASAGDPAALRQEDREVLGAWHMTTTAPLAVGITYYVARGNLRLIGDDAACSVDVAPGYEAAICTEPGLTGCVTLPAGRHAPLPGGLDQAMSSLRVTRVG